MKWLLSLLDRWGVDAPVDEIMPTPRWIQWGRRTLPAGEEHEYATHGEPEFRYFFLRLPYERMVEDRFAGALFVMQDGECVYGLEWETLTLMWVERHHPRPWFFYWEKSREEPTMGPKPR